MKTSRRGIWQVVGQATVLLCLWCATGLPRSFAGEDEAGGAVPPAELRARVEIVTAAEGNLAVRVHATAVVIARPGHHVPVATKVGGLVLTVEAIDGDEVKVGAPLVRLDSQPFQEALAKAHATVRAAQAELDRALAYSLDADQSELDRAAADARALLGPAQKEAARLTGLLASGLASEKAVADARAAVDAGERAAASADAKAKAYRERGRAADIARLEAAVALARTDVAPAERALAAELIAAPCAGRLSRFTVTRGQAVEAGQVIGEVTAPDALALRCSLVPSDAESLALGAPAEVGGRDWKGSVASVAGAVDTETGMVAVVVDLTVSGKAPRVGETVLVEIDRGDPVHGILLPAAALEVRDDLPRVMVVGEGDLAHLLTVTLLARGPDHVLVSGEGLAAGARVVVDGNYNLPDGAHVAIGKGEKREPDAAPAPPAAKAPGDK